MERSCIVIYERCINPTLKGWMDRMDILYCIEYSNEQERFFNFFQTEKEKLNDEMDVRASYDMLNMYSILLTEVKLLNKEEVKYCVKKVIEKEPFMTKTNMLGALHHTTVNRYQREYGNNLCFHYGNNYKVEGYDIVAKHNEKLLTELYNDGLFTYEKYKGSYKYNGKDYDHYILKLK